MKIHSERKEFGFLNNSYIFEFDSVKIEPLPDFDEISKNVIENSNIDGFIYPPEINRVELDPITNQKIKDIPRTGRPASVFNLPPSHSINIQTSENIDDPIISHEALFVHSLAFLYGTRLQFKEWRFDGRVPIKPTNNWYLKNETALNFLSHIYDFWSSLNRKNRKAIINFLYVHTYTRSLERQWNTFIHGYMLTDAIWRFWCDNNEKPKKRIKHKDRITFLCDFFNINYKKDDIKLITDIRNELFHESLWTGNIIGHGFPEGEQENAHIKLMKLNERLICSVIGYNNKFSRTPWAYLGTWEFDEYNNSNN